MLLQLLLLLLLLSLGAPHCPAGHASMPIEPATPVHPWEPPAAQSVDSRRPQHVVATDGSRARLATSQQPQHAAMALGLVLVGWCAPSGTTQHAAGTGCKEPKGGVRA
jgi:hypothetical protein